MIQFRQKDFSEHDAMNFFYAKIMEMGGDRSKWKIIDRSALIPILKGNNIVIEKFNIVSNLFKDDRFRMYLRIGAKAKLPETVRLPKGPGYDRDLGNIRISITNGGIKSSGVSQQDNGNGNQKKDKGGADNFRANWSPDVGLKYHVDGDLMGKTVKYDKSERTLVLEFDRLHNAIRALNYLPFGFGYDIYLLDSK